MSHRFKKQKKPPPMKKPAAMVKKGKKRREIRQAKRTWDTKSAWESDDLGSGYQ